MDEGDILLNVLLGMHPTVRTVVEWVSFASTIIVVGITLSPWKGDDEALEKVKKMPFIGNLIAALLKFSPLASKKKD